VVNDQSPGDDFMTDSLNQRETVAAGRAQLIHSVGMHARPAVKLTKLAKRFSSEIGVRVAGAADWIDAKSVASVVAMRAARDSIIEFEATGADAEAAVAALVLLVEQDFPETVA
jgi:phosphocarrier protein HPr